MRKNIRKMYTYVAKNLITVAIYKCVLKSLRLARGTLKFLFRPKLGSQLLIFKLFSKYPFYLALTPADRRNT